MVFEKLNDNQIKCVLDKEDLFSRKINIKDLFYGSPETEQLFKEVVSKAQVNFDFNTQKFPISIDAIPLPNDTLVIIITIVEDPEEIDSRFSRFTPDPNAASDKLFSSKADTSAGHEDIFSFLILQIRFLILLKIHRKILIYLIQLKILRLHLRMLLSRRLMVSHQHTLSSSNLKILIKLLNSQICL